MFNERELRGVVCPECGGMLLQRDGKAWCDWCDEYVKPVRETRLPVIGGPK